MNGIVGPGEFDPDGFFFVGHFPGSEAAGYFARLFGYPQYRVGETLSIFSRKSALYASSLIEIVLVPILMYVYTCTDKNCE